MEEEEKSRRTSREMGGGEGRMDGANEGGVRGEHGCERVSV